MRAEDGGQPKPRKRRSEYRVIKPDGITDAQSNAYSNHPRYRMDEAREPGPQPAPARLDEGHTSLPSIKNPRPIESSLDKGQRPGVIANKRESAFNLGRDYEDLG